MIIKSQKGLSLIEVLIAITLLAFIVMAVLQFTNQSFITRDNVVKEDNDKLRIETALSIMEWDFTHLYSPLFFSKQFSLNRSLPSGLSEEKIAQITEAQESIDKNINERYRNNQNFFIPNEKGIPVPRIEQNDKSQVRFFTNGNRRKMTNTKISNFSWIMYNLEDPSSEDTEAFKENFPDSVKGSGKNLVRFSFNEDPFSNKEIDFNNTKGQVILERIDDVEFTFWNSEQKKFVPLNSVPNGQGLVYAVKVSIKYRNIYDVDLTADKIFRMGYPKTDQTPIANPLQQNQKEQTEGEDVSQ